MKARMILNDAPYGSERTYSGLRLAGSLARQGAELRLFLIGDAASCAKAGQQAPSGYYNTQHMLGAAILHETEVPDPVAGDQVDEEDHQRQWVHGDREHDQDVDAGLDRRLQRMERVRDPGSRVRGAVMDVMGEAPYGSSVEQPVRWKRG